MSFVINWQPDDKITTDLNDYKQCLDMFLTLSPNMIFNSELSRLRATTYIDIFLLTCKILNDSNINMSENTPLKQSLALFFLVYIRTSFVNWKIKLFFLQWISKLLKAPFELPDIFRYSSYHIHTRLVLDWPVFHSWPLTRTGPFITCHTQAQADWHIFITLQQRMYESVTN